VEARNGGRIANAGAMINTATSIRIRAESRGTERHYAISRTSRSPGTNTSRERSPRPQPGP
jgi:hypothetical protein